MKQYSDFVETKEQDQNIENQFVYHKPFGDQTERYQQIRDEGKKLALLITKYCPPSNERYLALSKLRESIMWANAAIACNEKDIETEKS